MIIALFIVVVSFFLIFRYNIRCNAILPGFFRTPMTETMPEKHVKMVRHVYSLWFVISWLYWSVLTVNALYIDRLKFLLFSRINPHISGSFSDKYIYLVLKKLWQKFFRNGKIMLHIDFTQYWKQPVIFFLIFISFWYSVFMSVVAIRTIKTSYPSYWRQGF